MRLRHVFMTLMLLGEITIGAGLMTACPAVHADELEVIQWARSRLLALGIAARGLLGGVVQRVKGKRRPPGFGGPAWGW